MRRVRRLPLRNRTAGFLARKQQEVNEGADVDSTWKKARQAAAVKNDVVPVLERMCGVRQRCMFCADSRGVDIEHFWPKHPYKERAFLWENLLLACTACNRKKGNRFDLDDDGNPLLIDPCADEPWDHLFFEPRTGCVVARHSPDTDSPDPRGRHTTDPGVLPLNVEAVTEGRQRTCRNLFRAVESFLRQAQQLPVPDAAIGELRDAIRDNDDYGLAEWFFLREGRDDPRIAPLREQHPEVWGRIESFVRTDLR